MAWSSALLEVFVGIEGRQVVWDQVEGSDLMNDVGSGDLLDCLPATHTLYEQTASRCSCCYRPQGSTLHHVSIMGYSLSFSCLDVRFDRPVIA